MKTGKVWLPDGEKVLKIRLLVLTEFTKVTDGRIPHDGMDCACIASRDKKHTRQTEITD